MINSPVGTRYRAFLAARREREEETRTARRESRTLSKPPHQSSLQGSRPTRSALMPHIFLDANGKDSDPAYHGVDGSDGLDLTSNGPARDGGDGRDAGVAEPGESGAYMKIDISSMAGHNAPQHTLVRVTADAVCPAKQAAVTTAGRRIFHPRKNEYVVPLADFESLDWTARGGKGKGFELVTSLLSCMKNMFTHEGDLFFL